MAVVSPILYSEHLFLRVKLHIFFKARTVTLIFCSHQIIFPVNREAAPLLSLLPTMAFHTMLWRSALHSKAQQLLFYIKAH